MLMKTDYNGLLAASLSEIESFSICARPIYPNENDIGRTRQKLLIAPRHGSWVMRGKLIYWLFYRRSWSPVHILDPHVGHIPPITLAKRSPPRPSKIDPR